MSDDDLPPPPKKIVFDDSDDDLPPPPKQGGAPVALDDSDDDLPPPPKPAGTRPVLDDSDDDLPPPPSAGNAKPSLSDDDDDIPAPPARTRTAHVNPDAADAASPAPTDAAGVAKKRSQSVVRRGAKDLHKEGFLLKQSPSWPYGSQKRWCVLQGRVMTYYENQQTTQTALGTLDLKGAEIVDVKKEAKFPNSFGLAGRSGQLKTRTYIFAAPTRDELQPWLEVLELATTEPKASELHWFEKMAQGTF
jgi:hypothetical protein